MPSIAITNVHYTKLVGLPNTLEKMVTCTDFVTCAIDYAHAVFRISIPNSRWLTKIYIC